MPMTDASTVAAGEAAGTPRTSASSRVRRVLSRYGLGVVLLLVIAVMGALKPETYLTADNLLSIAESQAITALLALAIVGILVVGEFDLSFASIFGLAQVLVIGLIVRQGLPAGVAMLAVLLMGVAAGLVNTLLVVRFQVSSFIATLGLSTILGGLSVGYSGGEVVTGPLPTGFTDIARGSLVGIALPVVYVVVIGALLHLVLGYSASGRRMTAVGGNRDAARLAGIRIGRSVTLAFALAGLVSAGAAIISGSQLGSGQPLLSASYLLPAYAGVFLGATTITPGRFNVWGTLIGVYLLGAGVTGLQQLGLDTWVQDAFNGAMLLGAVAVSGYFTRHGGSARSSVTR